MRLRWQEYPQPVNRIFGDFGETRAVVTRPGETQGRRIIQVCIQMRIQLRIGHGQL
jgi:hypothetical protein